MTAEEFRELALAMPGAAEMSHMGHPDFRAGGKIFATLAPDQTWGMVKLTPEQQAGYLQASPEVFTPAQGAWGRGGATLVTLKAARQSVVREAMEAAWANVTAKGGAKRRSRTR